MSLSFRSMLAGNNIMFFDGGLGTMLQARGLPAGISPEVFCLENIDVLQGIHSDYAMAGADILTTNTFGGTNFKLPLGLDSVDFNRRMAIAAKSAAQKAQDSLGRPIFIAGSIGPTGKFLRPLGELDFDTLVDAFRLQIRGLVAGGADLLIIETQFDIAETRAAVVAARRECELPIAASMTFEAGLTLTGSTPEICVATLANMGVDIIGTNCSAGPDEIRDTAGRILHSSPVPVVVQANAGLPELVDGNTVFRLDPASFAQKASDFAASGARFLGGCCGTTPEHIAALKRAVQDKVGADLKVISPSFDRRTDWQGSVIITTRTAITSIGGANPVRIIGERINPTGKKQLTQEFQNGEFTTALRFSDEQIAMKAAILDVNTGAPLVDETRLLPDLASKLLERHDFPLSLDSPNAEAIALALKHYPASALVNSISGEKGRMEFLGPVCREFGAPFVLLPLKGKDLPETASDRIAIIEGLLEQMQLLGIPRRLAVVDCLVLAASSNPDAAKECLKFIEYCKHTLGLPTVAGLSNISFGLPARELVNAGFLTVAAGAGLSACIANPGSTRIQEAVTVSNLLAGKDQNAEVFITNFASWTNSGSNSGNQENKNTDQSKPLTELTLESAIILGRKDEAMGLLEKAIANGEDPFRIVNERLIPAITEVGAKYERKEYFLPQLLRSAESMQSCFTRIKPLLEKDGKNKKNTVIVMATVEGDIHDIGKNIVNLMLGNHGFEVIDLGKDVSAEDIVKAAEEHNADLIGLSALMTTTMVRMEDTIKMVRSKGLPMKVIIGGAVISKAFADSIGADGFALDAVEAVRVAKELSC